MTVRPVPVRCRRRTTSARSTQTGSRTRTPAASTPASTATVIGRRPADRVAEHADPGPRKYQSLSRSNGGRTRARKPRSKTLTITIAPEQQPERHCHDPPPRGRKRRGERDHEQTLEWDADEGAERDLARAVRRDEREPDHTAGEDSAG